MIRGQTRAGCDDDVTEIRALTFDNFAVTVNGKQ